jgi:uncharacterized protein YgiM (DUF1202 family)
MANKNRKSQNDHSDHHNNRTDTDNQKQSNKKQKQAAAGFDATALFELVKKYKRYIGAGVLFLAMVVILVKFTGPVDTPDQTQEPAVVEADLTEEFHVDKFPEVNELISNYYQAYAAGDVTALEEIAQPISDTEKSYIQVFSDYVDSYENLSCYTKSGLNEGEYVVSVYLEMKFKDVATTAPGLDFFYLRTDENGKLYIDNAYSQFNQSNMEESTQADIQALINDFEQAEDVVALQEDVQKKYEQAVAEDADLETMANQTIPDAISAWVESLTQSEDTTQVADASDGTEDAAEGDASSDETEDQTEDASAADDEDADSQQEDTKKNTNGDAKKAYAMDAVNLRKGPSTDDKVVIQIPLGDALKIYPDTEKDGWVKAAYSGKRGYVKLEYVTTKKSEVPSAPEPEEETTTAKSLPEGKEITLSDSVNVRVSMSETSDRVGLAYQGDVVKVIQSYAEGWTKVEWNGQTGYIKTDLIK